MKAPYVVVIVVAACVSAGCATTSSTVVQVTSAEHPILRRPPPPGTSPEPAPLSFEGDGRFAWVDGVTGQPLHFDDVVQRLRAQRVVVVGEQHDQLAHHEVQRRVVEVLAADGPGLAVGLEMLTWERQPTVDRLNSGDLDAAAFAAAVDWKKTWGFDFGLYAPIFETGLAGGARFVALNAPRTLVRAVRVQGIDGLSEADAALLPELDLGDVLHRRWFESIFRSAGHPLKDEEVDGFYRAQVLWDESMADRAAGAVRDGARQVVVIAGAGHVAAGRGIPQRIERRLGERVLTVLPMTLDAAGAAADLKTAIANGDADILVVPRFEIEIFL